MVWGCFLVLAVLTRYVSLGSSSTGVALPIVTWVVYQDGLLLLLSLVIGGSSSGSTGATCSAWQRGPSPSSISIEVNASALPGPGRETIEMRCQ